MEQELTELLTSQLDRLYRFAAARDMKKITRKKKGGQSSRRELPEEWRQMREDGFTNRETENAAV